MLFGLVTGLQRGALSCFFVFKQKTAYEMRISDWSSDVCSSDLGAFMTEPKRTMWLIQVFDGGEVRFSHTVPVSLISEKAMAALLQHLAADRKSVVEGKSVSVRVDIGGRSIIKKKN